MEDHCEEAQYASGLVHWLDSCLHRDRMVTFRRSRRVGIQRWPSHRHIALRRKNRRRFALCRTFDRSLSTKGSSRNKHVRLSSIAPPVSLLPFPRGVPAGFSRKSDSRNSDRIRPKLVAYGRDCQPHCLELHLIQSPPCCALWVVTAHFGTRTTRPVGMPKSGKVRPAGARITYKPSPTRRLRRKCHDASVATIRLYKTFHVEH